jgi:hypothetical protein
MGPISYPEPPLPPELQAEIETSMRAFKDMWPGFLQHVTEDYAPRYRAEITKLVRLSYRHGFLEMYEQVAIQAGYGDVDTVLLKAIRAETPVPHEKDDTKTI